MFKIVDFISYWYMRYLLVSELYLVEKWERYMIRILFNFDNSLLLNLCYLRIKHISEYIFDDTILRYIST